MGMLKFACAAGVMAAAAGTAYLYRRFRKTPEQEEVNMATSLRDETLMVANDYMDFCIGIKRTPPSESAKAMRYMAKEVEKEYEFRLRRLVRFFFITSGFNTWTELKNVMLEMVGHESMSWSQIVTLFAFTGILAVQLSNVDEDVACSRRLAEMITDVLLGEKEEWIIQNGGWRGFVDYVHTAKPGYPDSPVKRALLAAANVTIAFLLISYLLKRTLPGLVPSSLVIFKKLPGTSVS
ncbi:anti-apoptotic protein NR13-like [Paramormyrops kingsleyae]|uniref:anti-apoptotic protein NR13-like n=1 Tax=Paramormyrops kingsleyae TaxID=1676925 RepID=UPI003B972B62